jgi:nitroimidazol reductase NimA-like FMN-containing flavoprotein (pyridoxamine 5'-phosphate oxidase superfamily)
VNEMTDDARAILNDNLIGAVATINEDGSPWISPLHIFSDEEAVYWFSYEDKQHSLNIERDPRVSLSLSSADLSQGPRGVYINGKASKLDVEETTEAKKLIEAKIGKMIPVFEKATAYRLPIGQFNSGKSTGNCWYFYS